MTHFPERLQRKLDQRKATNSLRELGVQNELIDFSTNDYLGFSKSEIIFKEAHQYLLDHGFENGATGSRLLTGNHKLYDTCEALLCEFHDSESALIFNSGYDANLGLFGAIPQRGDVILYDELIHASIRDGITMSQAKSYKFKHNDLVDLDKMIDRVSNGNHDIYVVTESIFSMDGDTPNLVALASLCKDYNAYLIVDEAHALGVFGKNGCGLVQSLELEHDIFARIVTFGKGLGCHGAAVLGSTLLKQYLVNFCRSFIYTTGLPPHSLATIHTAYNLLIGSEAISKVHKNISFFKSELRALNIEKHFIESVSTIQSCIISGNNNVKTIANHLQENGFDVKPIMSPTVPEGEERLRFCIHSYNTEKEITKVLALLATFVKEIN